MLHSEIEGILASNETRSGRRRHRAHVETIQQNSVVVERVDVRRWNLIRAPETDIVEALIVCADDDDVFLSLTLS